MATVDDLQKRQEEIGRRFNEILAICEGDQRGPSLALGPDDLRALPLQAEWDALKKEAWRIGSLLRRYQQLQPHRAHRATGLVWNRKAIKIYFEGGN